MSILIPSTFISPSYPSGLGTLTCKSQRLASRGTALFISSNHGAHSLVTEIASGAFKRRQSVVSRSAAVVGSSESDNDSAVSYDWWGQELDGDEDLETPWEGAVIYRRNSLVSHLEYCTTLERLGLEKLSTNTSKSRASAMGLRVTKSVKDYALGTPVQISIDVTRKRKKKKKLRLDGIVRTVITLGCNRYFCIQFPYCFSTLLCDTWYYLHVPLLVWDSNCLSNLVSIQSIDSLNRSFFQVWGSSSSARVL